MINGKDGFVPGPGFSRTSLARAAAAVALVVLVGCESDPLAIFEDEPPAPQTATEAEARARTDASTAAAEDADTPDLRSVPDRPSTTTPGTREKVVEGLIADRQNARYTDEAIRLQGAGRQSAAPSVSSKAAEASQPQSAAVVPPAPKPESPMPEPKMAKPVVPVPTAPAPRTETGVPSAPSPVPPAPATVPSPRAASVPAAPVPTPRASTDSSVVVDRSALESLGRSALPGRAPISSAGGEQIATIQFSNSSSSLDARDREILRQVATIQRQSGGNLVVVGHASSRTRQLDKVKHEIANLNISMARASAVAEALIDSGVSRDQVVVEAFADGRPMFSEAMPTGEAGNRRAEIFLVR